MKSMQSSFFKNVILCLKGENDIFLENSRIYIHVIIFSHKFHKKCFNSKSLNTDIDLKFHINNFWNSTNFSNWKLRTLQIYWHKCTLVNFLHTLSLVYLFYSSTQTGNILQFQKQKFTQYEILKSVKDIETHTGIPF